MNFINLFIIYFTLFITTIFVGIVGNAIGIGGGILLVPFFIFYMHLSPLEASGLSLFTIMLSTLGGSYIFYKDKTIDLNLSSISAL
ncbi:MAG: TSUP family transporter [Deltaproteobacteria bacterium]|nr:TSUP family transporter [Deltaproteobacteria bacterium]